MLFGNRTSISFFLAYTCSGDDRMNLEVGCLVSRISHQHDILFKIVGIHDNVVDLQGVNVRLCADAKKEDLIEPIWTLNKIDVLNGIDKELARRNTYQGKRVGE